MIEFLINSWNYFITAPQAIYQNIKTRTLLRNLSKEDVERVKYFVLDQDQYQKENLELAMHECILNMETKISLNFETDTIPFLQYQLDTNNKRIEDLLQKQEQLNETNFHSPFFMSKKTALLHTYKERIINLEQVTIIMKTRISELCTVEGITTVETLKRDMYEIESKHNKILTETRNELLYIQKSLTEEKTLSNILQKEKEKYENERMISEKRIQQLEENEKTQMKTIHDNSERIKSIELLEKENDDLNGRLKHMEKQRESSQQLIQKKEDIYNQNKLQLLMNNTERDIQAKAFQTLRDDLNNKLKNLQIKYAQLDEELKTKQEENKILENRNVLLRENLKGSRNECITLKQEFNNFKGLNNLIEAKKHVGIILFKMRESLITLDKNAKTILFNVDLLHQLTISTKEHNIRLLNMEQKFTLLDMECSQLELLINNEQSGEKLFNLNQELNEKKEQIEYTKIDIRAMNHQLTLNDIQYKKLSNQIKEIDKEFREKLFSLDIELQTCTKDYEKFCAAVTIPIENLHPEMKVEIVVQRSLGLLGICRPVATNNNNNDIKQSLSSENNKDGKSNTLELD